AQTIISILEWFGQLDIARRKLCRQGVRIGNMQVGVPAGDAFLDVSGVVRHRSDADILEDEHRSAALDNAEEDVVRFGPLKRDVEPETIAIKGQRGGDAIHDEEGSNAGDVWLSHVTFHSGCVPERSPRRASPRRYAGTFE